MFGRLILILIIASAGLFNANFYTLNVQNIYNGMNFYRAFNQIDNLLDWEFKRVGVVIEPCNGKNIVVAHFSN